MAKEEIDWNCKKHGTFGDKGWSCAHCGHPIGFPVMSIKKGKLVHLRRIINLLFFKIAIYE